MQIAFYTLGCKVNQFESWAIQDAFLRHGCTVVNYREAADIYIVNTCTVTSRAAYQSRQIIRRLRRERPDAKIIATGCHVQTDASTVLESAGTGVCLAGNPQKHLIAEQALKSEKSGCTGIFITDISRQKTISPLFLHRPPANRTRAYLKVQDGCNAFCTYCIVPYARGRSRSLPPEDAIRQVDIFSKAGIREIVVTGIHVGHYGKDLKDPMDLLMLLDRLCHKFKHISFRLSSIEPTEISPQFIKWAAETDNFCPHFHIPLQSGSDTVLAAMNRHYSASFFLEILESIAESIKNCCIGTDVMTGFPTERSEDFQATAALLETAPVSYVHAFPYSSRPGTVAEAMKPVCSGIEAKERAALVREIGMRKRRTFFERFAREKLDVLVEKRSRDTGLFTGYTPNYLPVYIESDKELKDLRNRHVKVQIDRIDNRGLYGKIYSKAHH